LGGDEKGREIARKTLNIVRTGVGAQAIGLAKGRLILPRITLTSESSWETHFILPGFTVYGRGYATLVEAARALVYKSATSEETSLDELERLSAVRNATQRMRHESDHRCGSDPRRYGYMRDYPLSE